MRLGRSRALWSAAESCPRHEVRLVHSALGGPEGLGRRASELVGNSAQFWLDLQSRYDIGVVEREKGAELAKRVRPADAA